MPTCKECDGKFPNVIRVDGKKRNLQHRSRCLDCDPFRGGKKVEFLTPRVKYDCCIVCGKGKRKLCSACRTKVRRVRAKKAAVAFLGGICRHCGWSGNIVAFEFHHVSGKKEFNLGNVGNKSWSVLKKELKKCQLLCSRCHRIEHSSRNEILDEVVEAYGGELTW